MAAKEDPFKKFTEAMMAAPNITQGDVPGMSQSDSPETTSRRGRPRTSTETTVAASFRLPLSLKEKLREMKYESYKGTFRSESDIVTEALREYFDRHR